jgi:hypothetical protein
MTIVVPPEKRECERCGRVGVWDEDRGTWTVATGESGAPLAGDPYCLHEWDINGTYNPFRERA